MIKVILFKWSLLDRKVEWHKDNPDECTFHQIFSAIMRSANGLKLKEKLIADSFVREAQLTSTIWTVRVSYIFES